MQRECKGNARMQGKTQGMQVQCEGNARECKRACRGMWRGCEGNAGECKGHAGECSCQPLDYQSLSAVPDKSDEIYSTFVEGLAHGRTCPRNFLRIFHKESPKELHKTFAWRLVSVILHWIPSRNVLRNCSRNSLRNPLLDFSEGFSQVCFPYII